MLVEVVQQIFWARSAPNFNIIKVWKNFMLNMETLQKGAKYMGMFVPIEADMYKTTRTGSLMGLITYSKWPFIAWMPKCSASATFMGQEHICNFKKFNHQKLVHKAFLDKLWFELLEEYLQRAKQPSSYANGAAGPLPCQHQVVLTDMWHAKSPLACAGVAQAWHKKKKKHAAVFNQNFISCSGIILMR